MTYPLSTSAGGASADHPAERGQGGRGWAPGPQVRSSPGAQWRRPSRSEMGTRRTTPPDWQRGNCRRTAARHTRRRAGPQRQKGNPAAVRRPGTLRTPATEHGREHARASAARARPARTPWRQPGSAGVSQSLRGLLREAAGHDQDHGPAHHRPTARSAPLVVAYTAAEPGDPSHAMSGMASSAWRGRSGAIPREAKTPRNPPHDSWAPGNVALPAANRRRSRSFLPIAAPPPRWPHSRW